MRITPTSQTIQRKFQFMQLLAINLLIDGSIASARKIVKQWKDSTLVPVEFEVMKNLLKQDDQIFRKVQTAMVNDSFSEGVL